MEVGNLCKIKVRYESMCGIVNNRLHWPTHTHTHASTITSPGYMAILDGNAFSNAEMSH